MSDIAIETAQAEAQVTALPRLPYDIDPARFWLVLLLLFGGFPLLVVSGALTASGDGDSGGALGLILMIVSVVAMVAGMILTLMYLYRAWAIIPADMRRTTPGKAVGFCFIPFFNYYWLFVAYAGWAKDYNAYLGKTGQTDVKPMQEALFFAYPILIAVSFVLVFLPGFEGIGNMLAISGAGASLVAIYFMSKSINHAIATRAV